MRCLHRRRWWLLTAVLVVVLATLPSVAAASNDPLVSRQWALHQIDAQAAWESSTGSGVRIGIVDTGVDLTHEDLGDKVVAHTNCIGSQGYPARCRGSGQDGQGHGTHMAGIAAATKDNGKGVAGMAPDAQLVLLAPGGAGTGTEDEDVLSSYWVEGKPNQYRARAGTSIAAPHVARAVALLLAKGLTPREAVDRILQSVDTRVACGANSPTCHGRLDVARAVGQRAGTNLDSPGPPPPLGPVEQVSRTVWRLLGL